MIHSTEKSTGVFAGGGEMGKLMRAIDWSKTALGPISDWSQALRTMVGVLLRNPVPMNLSWGPQFLQLYNDAFRSILGAKHPKAMGQPARECWSEIWPIVGPMIEAPYLGRAATRVDDLTLLLDRKGFLEEAHFNVAYSSVPDQTIESTGIGGVLGTVVETTEQVYGERQQKTLRELGARASEAKTPEQACEAAAASLGESSADVPFCLLYLLDQEGKQARLVARCGFGADAADDAGWTLVHTVKEQTMEVITDLRERFGALPQGRWLEPPRLAISLPLASPDQPRPYGVLIAGVNPHRELDDGYQTFFELAAAQVVIAIHNARAREEERHWAEKLHSLCMQAPGAICILEGPRHTFTFANPGYCALVGDRKLLGRPLLEALPEIEGQGFDVLLEQVMTSGEPFVGNEVAVWSDRSGTGPEELFITFLYSPKRNARGEVDGVFVYGSEVTKQVHAHRHTELLVEELKLADLRKDEFLAMLAHELRNPMAAISMALSMLERVEGDPARTAKHRETARRQIDNLVRLVDGLLDVSRITSGKVELRTEEVDLASIVQNALGATRPAIEARGHELTLTVGPGVFRMDADPTRLEQVVVNLLSNAAKYTEPGGTLSVRLSREVVSGVVEAVLCVRDTGRGIPKDMLDKVFDLFVQVAPTIDHSAGGLGLGLTLVRRLVELHGGTVAAISEGPGRGSELVVRLPLAKGNQATAYLHFDGQTQAPSMAAHKRRILIVEDSEDVRNTLQEILEDLGHEVTVAVNGPEGVAKLLALRPDVALVDVGLPGIDGYEVARRVRADPGGDQLYLVALTGYGGPEAEARSESAGFDLHLTKPVNIRDLQQAVSRSKGAKASRAGA